MIERAIALTAGEWWAAAAEHRLLLLRCPACGATWVPWMPHCPDCGPGSDAVVIESSGEGRLYSWAVIHHSVSYPDETPFAVGSVLLAEGAMIYGRLTPEAAASAEADAPLAAVFTEHGGRTIIDFGPR